MKYILAPIDMQKLTPSPDRYHEKESDKAISSVSERGWRSYFGVQ